MASTVPALEKEPRVKKKRWPKIVMIILAVLIVIIAGAFGYGYWVLHRAVPETSGTLKINGLNDSVKVYRDQNGVPHIVAKNKHDLYIAQGYVTAQDRLFQMDLSRRQASGTLSEVVGKAAVDKDKFFRAFGLRRAAEASLKGYSKSGRDVLQWYADGVNAYMKHVEKDGGMPAGFRILGYQPKPWTPTDSLTIGKYMAYDLGGHWEGQAFRYYLLNNFPKEKAEDLFPSYPKDAPTIVQPTGTASAQGQTNSDTAFVKAVSDSGVNIEKSFAKADITNPFNGSNNWVVSGDKTTSGKPYLSNDPHLGLATPSIWYETQLKGPDVNVSGVIFAGVPGIILGHNPEIAWGVTNVGPDVQDLYIEKRNPDHPDEFLYNGKWEKAKVVNEDIKVKGEKKVPYNVTITRHGPIISEFAHDNKPDTALAMKWTALQPTTELEAVLQFDKAQNWDEFKKALTHFQAPAQNFVFASKDGTIAYRANGLIPIRKAGNSMLPVPGWTDKYEWKGYIPWDKLPTVVNPKEGFIVSANNEVEDSTYPYHISNEWAQPYRSERIREVLSSSDKLTVNDMMKLQFDHKDLQAEQLLPILLNALKEKSSSLKPVDKKAITMLEKWNRVDDKDLGAPLVYNLWINTIDDVLFKGQISKNMLDLFEDKGLVVDQLVNQAAEGNPGPWIKEKGGLSNIAYGSFTSAVSRAVELQGKDPSQWKWGDFHQVAFHHPLSAVKPLNLVFDPGSTPMGGSCVTVGAACWNWDTGEVDHGAPWRTVVDMADPLKAYSVVGPGESGHPLSPNYKDQIADWTTGKYHVTYNEPDAYEKGSSKLVLEPKN